MKTIEVSDEVYKRLENLRELLTVLCDREMTISDAIKELLDDLKEEITVLYGVPI